MADFSIFAERLGELIFDGKINAGGLGASICVSKSTVYRYLSGQRVPETEILVKIADYFECTTDFLLGVDAENYGEKFHACPPFSLRLRALLDEFRISKYRLSRKAGVPESILYTWQNGKCSPTLESIVKLAAYFGCSCDYILGRVS